MSVPSLPPIPRSSSSSSLSLDVSSTGRYQVLLSNRVLNHWLNSSQQMMETAVKSDANFRELQTSLVAEKKNLDAITTKLTQVTQLRTDLAKTEATLTTLKAKRTELEENYDDMKEEELESTNRSIIDNSRKKAETQKLLAGGSDIAAITNESKLLREKIAKLTQLINTCENEMSPAEAQQGIDVVRGLLNSQYSIITNDLTINQEGPVSRKRGRPSSSSPSSSPASSPTPSPRKYCKFGPMDVAPAYPIQEGAFDSSPLHKAIANREIVATARLNRPIAELNAKVNGWGVLHLLIHAGDIRLLKHFLSIPGVDATLLTDDGWDALRLICYSEIMDQPGVDEIICTLLHMGLDIDEGVRGNPKNFSTPINIATYNNRTHPFTSLFNKGATTHALDDQGLATIHYCTMNNMKNIEMLKLILTRDNSIGLTTKVNQTNAIMYAAENYWLEAIKLLEATGKIDIHDEDVRKRDAYNYLKDRPTHGSSTARTVKKQETEAYLKDLLGIKA